MMIDPGFILTAFLDLLPALPVTLSITGISVFVGLFIGTVVTLLQLYRVPVFGHIAAFYVTFIRGTPMLMHLFLVYFGLPVLIDGLSEAFRWPFTSAAIPIIYFVCTAFSLTAGAYLSEVIRSGILAVDRGQMEAAYSVGMSTSQMLRRIVFPQAFAASLPNLSNSVIGMLHGSTLAFTVSVVEVNGKANIVGSTNWKFFESFIAAALLYWGITLLIEKMASLLEKRFHMYNRGGAA